MDMNAAARIWGQTSAAPGTAGRSAPTGVSFLDRVYETAAQSKVEETAKTQAPSLEAMLKAKYPELVYHVFDASTSYWRTREDYPFHLLYQENIDTKALEDWKPTGPNPSQTSAGVQRNLASIPPGSKAVIIHPKVQERMEQDPDYAWEIMQRIDAWFAFDVARNEAILPGSTVGMSQSIAIGEDGSIVNVQASTGPRLPSSKKDDDDDQPDFWEQWINRHNWYMQRWTEKQHEHSANVSGQFAMLHSAQMAKARLLEMLNSDGLKGILGDTIAGTPLDKVLDQTRQDAFGAAGTRSVWTPL